MNDTKNDDFYIGKIINDLKFIIDHTAGKTQKDIEVDELLKDSIMLRIMRISESIDQLTEPFKSAHKEIPWNSTKGLADKIEHDYDSLDLALVYDFVFHWIPDMYEKMNTSKEKISHRFHRIKAVLPLPNLKLSVQFLEGVTKTYDVKPLIDLIPMFSKLKDDIDLFSSVQTDVGGYGVSWNDDLDISCDEIWEHSIQINELENR